MYAPSSTLTATATTGPCTGTTTPKPAGVPSSTMAAAAATEIGSSHVKNAWDSADQRRQDLRRPRRGGRRQ